MWTSGRAPNNASKWEMGFNSVAYRDEQLFSEMNTAKKRTEIDPTMKDHTAVFALQLLKHIRYQHLCDQ
jgi:hypothetical protein